MSFSADWKKAGGAFFSPLSLISLIISLALNVAAAMAKTGSGWQVLYLVFAAVSASAFGGIVVWRYIDAPSPLALKAESAREIIGIVRNSVGKRRSATKVIDEMLDLAQRELQ